MNSGDEKCDTVPLNGFLEKTGQNVACNRKIGITRNLDIFFKGPKYSLPDM
jgi:hypothetical protein